MILGMYITRRFFSSVMKVLVVFLAMVLLFDTVETMRDLSASGATGGQIVRLALVRLPGLAAQLFPLVILIGSLWTFLGLARSSELVVSRAAGVSGLRLIAWPMALTFLMGILAFAVLNPIVAATHQREVIMRDAIEGTRATSVSLSGQNIWLRQSANDGQIVVQAGRAEPDGSALHDVRLFEFSGDGRVTMRIEADLAQLRDGQWVMQDARRWLIDDAMAPLPEVLSELVVPTDLTRDQLLDSFAQPQQVSFWNLPAYIKRLESSGFSSVRHRLHFQTELARPLIFLAMALIGAAFAMRPTRFGGIGLMILGAVVSGFAFYFMVDVAVSFGAARQIPIGLAAWAPPIAAIFLSVALLLHLEDG